MVTDPIELGMLYGMSKYTYPPLLLDDSGGGGGRAK